MVDLFRRVRRIESAMSAALPSRRMFIAEVSTVEADGSTPVPEDVQSARVEAAFSEAGVDRRRHDAVIVFQFGCPDGTARLVRQFGW